MLLFDLIDEIFRFLIKFIPAGIAIISMFYAYYYYRINDPSFCKNNTEFKIGIIPTKDMIPESLKKIGEKFTGNKNVDRKTVDNTKTVDNKQIKIIDNSPMDGDDSPMDGDDSPKGGDDSLNGNDKDNEGFTNYFCKKGCKMKDRECKFNLTKDISFKCPNDICLDNNICKEKFENNQMDFNNYYCFNSIDCIEKEYDHLNPYKNSCGEQTTSQIPNPIYKSREKCYEDNINHKFFNKEKCLEQQHGYGWLPSEGCIKGSPSGPNDIKLDYTLHGKNRFIASNPDAFILPQHDFKYTPYLY
jgi:hypothetical protein